MDILTLLIPVSLFLGGLGLAFFVWSLRARQFEDPLGAANRILTKEFDEHPKP
ncbi:MAG: RdxS, cytochrome oxidase maturation protein cbb3-type [Pseudomonadota bacterium]|jgi:cbb3-type cytochrome oxidase maturation protein